MKGNFFKALTRYNAIDEAFYKKKNMLLITAVDALDNDAIDNRKYVSILKIEIKDSVAAKLAYHELVLSKSFQHKRVIKLLNAFSLKDEETGLQHVYFVTRYMPLNLKNIQKLNHYQISFLMHQTLNGVYYLNKLGLMHCDLKPENLGVTQSCRLKILSWGSVRRLNDNDATRSQYFVNRKYRPPEVLLGLGYDFKLDIWSIGCIFAELILKKPLFHSKNLVDQWKTIVEVLGSPDESYYNGLPLKTIAFMKTLKYAAKSWDEILPYSAFQASMDPNIPKELFLTYSGIQKRWSNANFRDIISKMLVIDPKRRISVHQALQHSYVSMFYDPAEIDSHVPAIPDTFVDLGGDENLREWNELISHQIQQSFPSM